MAKKKLTKIPIFLTPEQIKEAYRRLLEEEEGDWMDDPVVLELLIEKEKKVAEEIKKGEFTTLEKLQAELGVR
ncbi:MAG: hypothetical protein M1536_03160 [Firmicutes bacterium]|nr:hypothetical protein [Bacillota bacterium]